MAELNYVIRKLRNSAGFTVSLSLPKSFLSDMGLSAGDYIRVSLEFGEGNDRLIVIEKTGL